MAEQKKKTKRRYTAKKKPKLSRKATTRRTTVDSDKRVYHAETTSASLKAGLGMPPLKMILVHAQNDRVNAAMKPATKSKKTLSQQEAVIKLIEHLTKTQ